MSTSHRTIPRITNPGLQTPNKSFTVSAPGICFSQSSRLAFSATVDAALQPSEYSANKRDFGLSTFVIEDEEVIESLLRICNSDSRQDIAALWSRIYWVSSHDESCHSWITLAITSCFGFDRAAQTVVKRDGNGRGSIDGVRDRSALSWASRTRVDHQLPERRIRLQWIAMSVSKRCQSRCKG